MKSLWFPVKNTSQNEKKKKTSLYQSGQISHLLGLVLSSEWEGFKYPWLFFKKKKKKSWLDMLNQFPWASDIQLSTFPTF